MDFPSHEWENRQLFDWMNALIYKTYGVLIARNNKNTRSGREQVALYTEIPSPFHFITGAYEKYGFDRNIQSFEHGKDMRLMSYVEDTFPKKSESRVIDLDTWLSEHIVPGSGYITSQDIHKTIESKGLAFSRNDIYNKIKEIFNTTYREKTRIDGLCMRKVVLDHILAI